MPETSPGPSRPGSVVLDIGGDTGALIIIAPASMDGHEIHVSPLGQPPAPRTHAVVRERRLARADCHAAVYPALAGGEYTVWQDRHTPAGHVVIRGGAVTSYRWPEAAAASGGTAAAGGQ